MDKDTKEVFRRLEKLEKAVFGPAKGKPVKKPDSRGPKGGIVQLISSDFFTKRRITREVVEKLESMKYYYRTSAVQTALNRLSKSNGLLTTSTISGKKTYAARK